MKTIITENMIKYYKGYEIFSDSAHYNMIAVRQVGEKRSEYIKYMQTIEQAKSYVDEQNNYVQKIQRNEYINYMQTR